MFALQLVVLFGEVMELIEGEILLEEMHHRGIALRVYSISLLPVTLI